MNKEQKVRADEYFKEQANMEHKKVEKVQEKRLVSYYAEHVVNSLGMEVLRGKG